MNRRLRFFLVGPGRVGLSLARALERTGHRCVGVAGGRRSSRERARRWLHFPTRRGRAALVPEPFEILLIAAPDRAIPQIAFHWANKVDWGGRFAWHTSGAVASDLLQPLREAGASVASIHPVTSLPVPRLSPGAFRGEYFGIEGDSASVALARRLIRRLGGRVFRIDPEVKALYHLMAALCSGYLLGMVERAGEEQARSGGDVSISRDALLALAQTTITNARRFPPGKALTGPLLRGDVETVRRHLTALESLPEEWGTLHRILLEWTLDLASRTQRIAPARKRTLLRRLSQAGAKGRR